MSAFASWLQRSLDETRAFSRTEWADILGVSEAVISQWLSDEAFPSAITLRRLQSTLAYEASIPGEAFARFRTEFKELASQPLSRIAPHAGRGMPATLAHYMLQPVRAAFLELLDTLPVERQTRALLNASRVLRCLRDGLPTDGPRLDELRYHVGRFLTVDGAACEANDAMRVADLFKALDRSLSAGGPLPLSWLPYQSED